MRTRMIAVRDVLSSDPYVVLKLGKQRVQRAEADSNLNPVWNEELMLSVPQNYGPIKLEVYDYDTFSAGDVMGEVEIDIQSMITLPLCSWMLRSLRTCRSGDG
ncbi:probable ADP-ribosylation factor GTPase-activating protein AGD13 [Salvia splendens]|nr:probable ADP-ribosylation factor GTPase-activating protein AGD13 [Salvia splendens]